MIKKYLEFINESFSERTREDFNSLGEWVEYLYEFYKDDEEKLSNLKSIVNRHFNVKGEETLQDIESDIRLSNAINILDDNAKGEMESLVKDFVENGIEDKEPGFEASTDLEPLTEAEISVSGKGVFTSFLKSITALGKKDVNADFEKCPDDYLFFYHYDMLNTNDVKSVFNRFSSLKRYLELIPYDKNEISLYFGIKSDGQFEYGVSNERNFPIGQFKLSTGVIKWILGLESKSAHNLKRNLVNYTYSDLQTLGKIKKDISEYNPGFFEKKSKVTINDKVISIGYQGIGKWDNGQLDSGEFMNLKTNFNNWIITKKWGSKIQFGIKPQSYWLYFNLKLK